MWRRPWRRYRASCGQESQKALANWSSARSNPGFRGHRSLNRNRHQGEGYINFHWPGAVSRSAGPRVVAGGGIRLDGPTDSATQKSKLQHGATCDRGLGMA